jgi:signal transduction histidine kinase
MRLAVVAGGLYRGITLTGVLAAGQGISTASMALAFAAVAVWDCMLVWRGWRRGGFPRGLVALDIGIALVVGLLALSWRSPGMRFGYGVLQGAAIVAGFSLPVGALIPAVSALVLVNFLTVLTRSPPGRITVTEFLAYAVTLIALTCAAYLGHGLLRLAADAVDRRHIGLRGVADEHTERQRMLHDTALATLTAIARGLLDVHSDEVRARCARDALLLRLTMTEGRLHSGNLPAALASAAAEAAAIGLRVHPFLDTLPSDLNPAVVTAIAMAVREAFNNVHRHARASEVWLTAAEEDRRIIVRIVDRGAGFTPVLAAKGSGIRDSICARMREVGGAALVESTPGEGTCIELKWPR